MKRLNILIPTVRTAYFGTPCGLYRTGTACVVLALLIGFGTANAQRMNEPAVPQSGYSIDWYTIDGGGAMNSVGGSYALVGGFWGGASINYSIYLPLVLKNF